MENHMGKQIRAHRLRGNMTQEKLAETLHVTSQAVSKWENGTSYPDVSLLPELSAALGVTLDELFETNFGTHLRRIERMLENERELSSEAYDYAEQRLKEGCLEAEYRGRCLTMLAELNNHRAEMYRSHAADYAKQALEIEPEKHDNHSAFAQASGGALADWCVTNHSRMISWYEQFVKKNPRYLPGYLWLLDNLLADGRLDEAREALEQMREVKETYHYLLYKGWLLRYAKGWDAADACWNQMVTDYPDDWHVWCSRADTYAMRTQYDKAISDYQKAASLQERPRFTDCYDSIAQLCILQGDKAAAAEAYRQVVKILREEWDMQEGETVLGYLQNIAELEG